MKPVTHINIPYVTKNMEKTVYIMPLIFLIYQLSNLFQDNKSAM